MARKYYSVISQEVCGLWYPQFGDYDKAVAMEEMRDMKDHEPATKMRVICTDDTQEAINAACARLNAGHPGHE